MNNTVANLPAIVDAQGAIGKIKSRMAKDCAVRKSPYCDHIIALRIKGTPFQKIRDWLFSIDPDRCIPTPTLARNLKKAFRDKEAETPLAVEIAEKWGGDLTMDLQQEILGQILVQRRRIDEMVRQEAARRASKPGYSNWRIRQEMETLATLTEQYTKLLDSNVPKGRTPEPSQVSSVPGVTLAPQARLVEGDAAIVELILAGKIKVALPPPEPK